MVSFRKHAGTIIVDVGDGIVDQVYTSSLCSASRCLFTKDVLASEAELTGCQIRCITIVSFQDKWRKVPFTT